MSKKPTDEYMVMVARGFAVNRYYPKTRETAERMKESYEGSDGWTATIFCRPVAPEWVEIGDYETGA